MPSLRSLLQDISPPTNRSIGVIYVYNDSLLRSHNPCDAGKCCLFTVPDGVSSVTFELWGGGGSGGNGYCKWPINTAGAGGYARRTVATVPGCQYTVCAAPKTGVCCTNGNGILGCKSFVSGSGIAVTCVQGGQPGLNCCYGYAAVNCFGTCITPWNTNCGDMSIPAVRGSMSNRGCYHRHNELMSGAAVYGGSNSAVNPNCCMCSIGCMRGYGTFPGGGGPNSVSCRCGRCGGPGQAGLVKITYS